MLLHARCCGAAPRADLPEGGARRGEQNEVAGLPGVRSSRSGRASNKRRSGRDGIVDPAPGSRAGAQPWAFKETDACRLPELRSFWHQASPPGAPPPPRPPGLHRPSRATPPPGPHPPSVAGLNPADSYVVAGPWPCALPLHTCNFATVMNHNGNTCYAGYLICNPRERAF
ncbi:hypothetical protein NN561_005755 [Cricetulus griseus]